jgi:hypothetical protein
MSCEFISFVHIMGNQKIRVRIKILIYKGKTIILYLLPYTIIT